MILKRDHDLRLHLVIKTIDAISHDYSTSSKTCPVVGLRLVYNFQNYRKEPCHKHCLATAPASYFVSYLSPIMW